MCKVIKLIFVWHRICDVKLLPIHIQRTGCSLLSRQVKRKVSKAVINDQSWTWTIEQPVLLQKYINNI